MTPRERVLSVLEHREVDRIPIDFAGHRSSGITAIAYAKLLKLLGMEGRPIRIYDPTQQLAIVDEEVLNKFGVDTIELGRGFCLDEESWVDWELPDGTPCQMPAWASPKWEKDAWVIWSPDGRVVARMPQGSWYFEQADYPLAERSDPKDIAAVIEKRIWIGVPGVPGPLKEGLDGERLLSEGARRLREKTNRAVIGVFGGNLLELGHSLFRNDNFFILLAAEPQKAHNFLDQILEMHLADLERYLAAVGDSIDVILFGDDLGMQTGPQISPKMYCEFFKPRHKRLWNRAKELANVKVMLHSCGGVRELLPHLIEAGIDAINPVQISCARMDAAELKQEFGKDIVFWGGGCDTQSILPNSTPEQIRKHVVQQIKILGNGGGFVFQQVHNIMPNVPPQNIVAMFDAVLNQG
ncbi:MAG: uroporphyrinogen decarboxylase family protein [Pseudomonadota bacterium]